MYVPLFEVSCLFFLLIANNCGFTPNPAEIRSLNAAKDLLFQS